MKKEKDTKKKNSPASTKGSGGTATSLVELGEEMEVGEALEEAEIVEEKWIRIVDWWIDWLIDGLID